MASVAVERPVDRDAGVNRAWIRAVLLLAVALLIWGAWEGFRALGIHYGWTRPFTVDATSMPHIHSMIQALFERTHSGGPLLIVTLLKAAAFTAREAALGFAMGAVGGFVIGALLAHSRVLQRGFLPYVVASQTVPILAIAPMVVIWFTNPSSLIHVQAWVAVAIIASYLTFFPVTIATLRGLNAADRQALELMRSYGASTWTVLWKLRFPTALPYLFPALKVAATACIVGAIIGESPSSIAGGLGGAILNFAQYYSFQPQNLWATNIVAAALGITFFLVVVIAEKIIVRRAPEHVA